MSTIDLALSISPIKLTEHVSFMPATTLAYPNILYNTAIIFDEDEDLRLLQRVTHIAQELYKNKYRITIKAVTERKGYLYIILDTTLRPKNTFEDQKKITAMIRDLCDSGGYDGDSWSVNVVFVDINSRETDRNYSETIHHLARNRAGLGPTFQVLIDQYPTYIIPGVESTSTGEIIESLTGHAVKLANNIKVGM